MLENGEFGLVYLVSSKSYRIWLRSIRGKSLFWKISGAEEIIEELSVPVIYNKNLLQFHSPTHLRLHFSLPFLLLPPLVSPQACNTRKEVWSYFCYPFLYIFNAFFSWLLFLSFHCLSVVKFLSFKWMNPTMVLDLIKEKRRRSLTWTTAAIEKFQGKKQYVTWINLCSSICLCLETLTQSELLCFFSVFFYRN